MNLLALFAVGAIDAATIAQNSATLRALGPHPFGSPRNQAAAQFLAAKLKEAGLTQTAVDEFEAGTVVATNVIVNIPGRSDRIVILATHHDTARDGSDLAPRSRALALLVDVGKEASRLRPAKTWILASFDGGAGGGEGFAHYLETLGKSRSSVDGMILIDAHAAPNAATGLTLMAPSCAAEPGSSRRGIAPSALVAAALGRVPATLDVSFDAHVCD